MGSCDTGPVQRLITSSSMTHTSLPARACPVRNAQAGESPHRRARAKGRGLRAARTRRSWELQAEELADAQPLVPRPHALRSRSVEPIPGIGEAGGDQAVNRDRVSTGEGEPSTARPPGAHQPTWTLASCEGTCSGGDQNFASLLNTNSVR